MVLFPIAIVWIGFVLYWAIVRNGVDTDGSDEGRPPRRWSPRRPPRNPGPRWIPGSWLITPPSAERPSREGPIRTDAARRHSRRDDAVRPERRRVPHD